MNPTASVTIKGIAGVKGVALARAYVYRRRLEVVKKTIELPAVEKELVRFEGATELTRLDILADQKDALSKHGSKYASIFDAHLLMLSDFQFRSTIETRLKAELVNIESIVSETINTFIARFLRIEDEYLRERAIDMQDVGDRLLRHLLGLEGPAKEIGNEPFLLLADEITPSELLDFSKGPLKGICLDSGGATSHVAILAGALNIPAVFGLAHLSRVARTGDLILIDSQSQGQVIIQPDEEMISAYASRLAASEEILHAESLSNGGSIEPRSGLPACRVSQGGRKRPRRFPVTLDGFKPKLGANISRVEELAFLKKSGVQRIGLFRSEFLFMECVDLPSEKFQEEIYQQVVGAAQEMAVLRTIDLGSDKPVKYLPFPRENNPSMGFRSIRYALTRPDVLLPQLRSMIRASQHGSSKIIFPMVSTIQELDAINAIWKQAIDQVCPAKVPEWGIMAEVPAAIFMMDIIAEYTRYISIGTNDLIQFVLGIDRTNDRLSDYFDPLSLPFLRLLRECIEKAHAEKITVGVCGVMAGEPSSFSFLLGLGADELSMRPGCLSSITKLIPHLHAGELKTVVNDLLNKGERNIRKVFEEKFFAPESAAFLSLKC